MSSEASIVGYCRTCGKALEAAEASGATGFSTHGVLYCTEHTPQAEPAQASSSSAPPPFYTAPAYHAATASPYSSVPPPLYNTPPPNPRSHISPGLAFVLGLIPGVGAVYNGQYAKGLVHVVILGVIFSILGNGAAHGFEPLFGILIPCFFFYMAFEAYHTAKKRKEGEAVEEFSGLMSFRRTRSSKFPAAPVLLIAFGVLFLLDNLDILKIGRLVRYWPALLIVFGCYLLYERVTEASDGRE